MLGHTECVCYKKCLRNAICKIEKQFLKIKLKTVFKHNFTSMTYLAQKNKAKSELTKQLSGANNKTEVLRIAHEYTKKQGFEFQTPKYYHAIIKQLQMIKEFDSCFDVFEQALDKSLSVFIFFF